MKTDHKVTYIDGKTKKPKGEFNVLRTAPANDEGSCVVKTVITTTEKRPSKECCTIMPTIPEKRVKSQQYTCIQMYLSLYIHI